jgi:hypothetical protein
MSHQGWKWDTRKGVTQNNQMYDWDRKRWNGSTIGGHTRRLGQLDCCGTVILRNANSQYGVKVWLGRKSQTGGRNSRNKEESGTTLTKARLSSCFCESLATTSLGQSKPNQSYPLRCIDTRPGQVRIPRKPSKWLELFWLIRLARITEFIRFIEIMVTTDFRFIWIFNVIRVIRACLREPGRGLLTFCSLVAYDVSSLA